MKFSMTEQDNGDRPGMFDCTVCIFLFMKFPFCLKAYRMSELIFFILKVANIRCFILIAVKNFHNIIRK
jgi:succinate-acetate transporter protein